MIRLILNFKNSVLQKNKGFTLIEILIFMGIFSILITVMLQLFTAIFDNQLESQSTTAVSTDSRYIENKLTADIKNATSSSILSPAIGASSSALSISNGSSTYTYSLSGNNLVVNEQPAGTTDQLNSVNTKVSSLNFFRLADNSGQDISTITVSFTLTSGTIKRSGAVSEDFNFTAGTR